MYLNEDQKFIVRSGLVGNLISELSHIPKFDLDVYKNLTQMNITVFSPFNQMCITLEEMSELCKELFHGYIYGADNPVENIIEEMADVVIMLNQVVLMFNLPIETHITKAGYGVTAKIVEDIEKKKCLTKAHNLFGDYLHLQNNIAKALTKYMRGKEIDRAQLLADIIAMKILINTAMNLHSITGDQIDEIKKAKIARLISRMIESSTNPN